ncbi:hypothetical protein B0H14DRAFT_1509851 [Mycena olivaceomarginata]|nr:hypothetical protein B0H14DRAFT_1509851 [Mycena olivaceomarginata]
MLDALAAVRSRIADIDTQILALERSLSALRTERALEQETLDSYKYPVLTAVPTEIISEIFIQFLPVYPLCPPSTGILSPTVLTQICRKWREIALETPTLWRAITLHLYNMPFDRQRHICDFLDRSGCCPLSIRSDDDLDLEPVPVVEIFAALISHRSRWEHLDILLSPSQLRAIDGPMPLLRNLHLSLDNNPDPDGVRAFECNFAMGAVDLPNSQFDIPIRIYRDFAACIQSPLLRVGHSVAIRNRRQPCDSARNNPSGPGIVDLG